MKPKMHGKGLPSIYKHKKGEHDHPGFYDDFTRFPVDDWNRITFNNQEGFEKYWAKFDNASQWIQDNILSWEENCLWLRVNDCSYFYFKNDNDAALFKLRWV